VAAVVETTDLTRSFKGRLALDGLTFDVQPGEVLALLGPNGAGKTTTVRLLNGVLLPDSGASRVLGLDPAIDGDAVRRRTGVLTEHAGLDERLTARENLVAAARMRGVDKREAGVRAGELLDRFAMGDEADRQVQGFSTGQRKRVALARALLHDPDVLFLDEPTSGLDPAATREVVELIATLASEHGRTVLLCTHFLGEAGRLAQRMAVLHRGRLRAFGRPDDLARQFWEGLDCDVDLGGAASPPVLEVARAARGVLSVVPTDTGLRARVEERAVVPELVARLVAHEAPVFAATPKPPTLEDVYFAVEARVRAEELSP
jgi:ABC-2 type transport system ATP-binding protein